MDGVEIAIAADGEISCARMRNEGLLAEPAETRGAARRLAHTAHGHLDDKGRIVITDRKKDMIVNDKGDNVARRRSKGCSRCSPKSPRRWWSATSARTSWPDRARCQWALEWRGERREVRSRRAAEATRLPQCGARGGRRVNADLSVVEKVRRIAFADEPFAIDNGEMTPSMKIRVT